ncbi:MAG: 2-dehydro-3-deoxy-L-arabinonate dehydratase [Geminicoccaceae bacterium]|nr:2-dehydro-3-deoxy-L-arabinonate dehydratase [Geminicoccaceae bacterium]MDF2780742.1 2-dehydro-3-deoxy-L-arabinonate dehydratase [Geminicoccaceae bacterium]
MAGHLLDESARGVFIIAATPFADNGTLDLKSLERLIGFYIDAGVHGITLLGLMGEAQKLTYDEARLVIQASLRQVAGEVPVVVGVSSPGLATLAALTSDAMSLGAAAVMVAPPSGLVTDEQVEGYAHQLCRAIGEDVPLVLQDYPQATGVHLSVAVLNRLIDDLPQIKVLKHEDCPGLGKLTRLRAGAARDGRRRIAVLVGNGGLYYPLELGRGADGAMTGFAYPEVLVEVYERFAAGREEAAFDLYDAYLPLIRYEQQPGVGLAIRKEILHRRGVLACPALRPPGARLDAIDRAELDQLIARLERRVVGGL